MTIAAIRHNNPGNVSLPIEGWHGGGHIVDGIPGQPAYAEFPTMHVGFEAFKQRIRSYIARGHDSIYKLFHDAHYATDPNWPHGVSKISGVNQFDRLGADSVKLARVAAAIIRQETGHSLARLGLTLED